MLDPWQAFYIAKASSEVILFITGYNMQHLKQADLCYALPLATRMVFPVGVSYQHVMGFLFSLCDLSLETVMLRSYKDFGQPPLPWLGETKIHLVTWGHFQEKNLGEHLKAVYYRKVHCDQGQPGLRVKFISPRWPPQVLFGASEEKKSTLYKFISPDITRLILDYMNHL